MSQAAYSADGFRGEAAVNLTDTIFGGSSECLAFANTIPSTVTGNSDTADYKDTILATTPPISNCETDHGDHAEGRRGGQHPRRRPVDRRRRRGGDGLC